MNRRLSGRLERLESHIGSVPDLVGEARQHGAPVWSVAGFRAYGQDAAEGARLAIVGPVGTVVYEVAGISLGDLT